MVQGVGFVIAGSLALGNAIVTRAGPALTVAKIEWKQGKQPVAVYNFEVEEDHTYFVGSANGGLWVHNPVCASGRISAAGKYDHVAGSQEEALDLARKAFLGGEEVPAATAIHYPEAGNQRGPWFQVHPAEPIVTTSAGKSWPHVKYEDWSRGKKSNGGSWGHIFFPPK